MSERAPSPHVPRRRRVVLLAWAACALAVAALGALAGGDAHVQRSPTYCASCHASVPRHPEGHAGMTCQTCHLTGARDRIALLGAHLTGARRTPPHGRTPGDRCVACHQEDGPRWRSLAATPGHAAHGASGTGNTDCVRCHGSSLHGRPSAGEGCFACHRRVPMLSEPRAESDCVRCHQFAPPRAARPGRPGRPDPDAERRAGLAPADAARVTVDHVHGAADCRACHNPHDQTSNARARATDCRRCHQGQIHAEVSAGPEGHRDCLGCHQVHADRAERALECGRCHAAPDAAQRRALARLRRENPAVGPDSALRAAARAWASRQPLPVPAVGPVPAPTSPAAAPLVPQNRKHWTHQGRCASCHRPHTWTARPADCRACHAREATAVSAVHATGHQDCAGCHEPHGPRPTGDTCERCHTDHARASRAAPAGRHRDCVACHAPHEGRPAMEVACVRCHGEAPRALRNGPAPHRNCASCHTPHGSPVARTRDACARCHQTEARSLAGRAVPARHQDCASCHANHDFAAAGARNACARCHSNVSSHAASHRGSCTQCHEVHAGMPAPTPAGRGMPAVRTTTCATCHAATRVLAGARPGAPHGRCASCHEPHRAGLAARDRCGVCHAPQVRAARTWPANSAHAGQCNACHQAHGPSDAPVACASCHAPQATPAHTGRHATCTGCHDPHQDRPREGAAGWWNRCGTCHTTQATAARASTSTHAACASCHQRAGLVAPTCASCHAAAAGTMLHGTQGHTSCATCHGTHGTRPPERPQCLSCHQRQVEHFPDAPRCQACHPFAQPGTRHTPPPRPAAPPGATPAAPAAPPR